MDKQFMKRYTLQRDPSEIESIYSDEKIGCEMEFTMKMAFESMKESFAKQSDEAIINFLIKKYRDTDVSDVFVFSETDFKQFIIDMVPKWRKEKEYLKWDDLRFKERPQKLKVLLNGNVYILRYVLDFYGNEHCCLYDNKGSYPVELNKNFFSMTYV